MVMVPIGSPLAVSYMISIVSNIVSLTAFEVFNVTDLWYDLGRFKVTQGQRWWQHTDDFLFDFYWPNIVPVTIFETFDG